MSFSVVGSFTLGEVSVAAELALVLFNPLLVQFDASLTGAFGLGALEADLSAQFNAALQAQLDLGLQISNPLIGFQAALTAIAQIQAEIGIILSAGLPTISAELNAGLSAQAAITALLAAKLGGLKALLELSLSLKIPAEQFLGDLAASLSAGPVFLLSFQGDPLLASGTDIGSAFAAGLIDGTNVINPGDTCYGVVLVTKAPAAYASMQFLLKTS